MPSLKPAPALAAALLAACAPSLSGASSERPKPQNILFISIDDLRPEIGAYGNPHMRTPQLDALASEGFLFTRAYCAVPVCGASRASVFTGLRPTPHRFLGYSTRADADAPNAPTLHAWLKEAGYQTASIGKVLHHNDDSASGWSLPPWRMKDKKGYQTDANLELREKLDSTRAYPYESAPAPDDHYPDAVVAQKAINTLDTLHQSGDPWFLAVGFIRPHLPFSAPESYWQRYPEDSIRLPESYRSPSNIPECFLSNFGELRNYYGVPESGPLSEKDAKTLIRGYYASVSHVDKMLGRLLDHLDTLGLRDDTAVIVWGDHGWQLGEHARWTKHSVMETSMRSPLIIRAPGARAAGKRVDAIVEFIDLFPTVCDLAAVDQPARLDGRSLLPLLETPSDRFRDFALGRYWGAETLRTDRYRYMAWIDDDGSITEEALFDHLYDPEENENVVASEEYLSTASHLRRLLVENAPNGERIKMPNAR